MEQNKQQQAWTPKCVTKIAEILAREQAGHPVVPLQMQRRLMAIARQSAPIKQPFLSNKYVDRKSLLGRLLAGEVPQD